jgi:hypothetical protein
MPNAAKKKKSWLGWRRKKGNGLRSLKRLRLNY